MSDILEIVNGISQALSAKHDGGEEFGLDREQEVSIYNKRANDGFGVSFHGNYITVKLHEDMPLEHVHRSNFKGDIEQKMANIVKNIKDKFKVVKKKSLDLKKCGECNIVVQTPNRRNAFVNAAQTYEFSTNEKADKMEDSFRERSDRYAKHWLNIMKK